MQLLSEEPKSGWMGDMFFAGRLIIQGDDEIFEIQKVFYCRKKCKEYIEEYNYERVHYSEKDYNVS